jgi:hypothetical protein
MEENISGGAKVFDAVSGSASATRTIIRKLVSDTTEAKIGNRKPYFTFGLLFS